MNTVIHELKNLLPELKILLSEDLKQYAPHVWRQDEEIKGMAMLLPSTTEEVSIIMKQCHQHGQPLVVHGGLTNLVSSTYSTEGDIIISMKRMNGILEVDPEARTITVEAGVILEEVLNRAKEEGMFFAVNYGAKGSAQIGGAVSTNAGGTRVLRYGMMREQILGIEAVLPDGTIVSSLKKIIKDNSGLDWKHLLIGTEGIFGIITKVVLKLREDPLSRGSAFVGVQDYDHAIRFLKRMDGGLGGMLSAFEVMWQDTYTALTSPPSKYRPPIPRDYPMYVLVEYLGGHQEKDFLVFEEVLQSCIEESMINDAVIATSHEDLKWFWSIREDVQPLLGYGAFHQTFDVSIPIPFIGEVVESTVKLVESCNGVNKCFALGHIADGNIHYIILKEKGDQELTDQINNIVYGPLADYNGSISAEHGIGLDKKGFLHISRSEEEIQLMKKLKTLFDPKGILNRGKVLP
ncbi:MAG: FAD-binding oxidoreductase [Saprospiraceae bacterium]|nr:FAD-binding oxidoreductase [Saprospiraceae bacterium]